jgi:hypothetical protein
MPAQRLQVLLNCGAYWQAATDQDKIRHLPRFDSNSEFSYRGFICFQISDLIGKRRASQKRAEKIQ